MKVNTNMKMKMKVKEKVDKKIFSYSFFAYVFFFMFCFCKIGRFFSENISYIFAAWGYHQNVGKTFFDSRDGGQNFFKNICVGVMTLKDVVLNLP